MAEFTIHGHPISQPARAVLWLCRIKGAPYEFKQVDVPKGTQTPEFAKLNPNKKIPILTEKDGFVLYESNAILAYLANKYKWTDWYPTEPRIRAKVDQYLHWHHHNTRQTATLETFAQYILVMRKIKEPAQAKEALEANRKNLEKTLGFLDQQLKDSPFLAGKEYPKPTIADLNAYCEIGQLRLLDMYDFKAFPNVVRWMIAMEKLPGFEESHEALKKAKSNFRAKL